MRRLTYANVMSTLGVFIALGGTATAAVVITGKNVKNGSLTSADIKDRSLRAADFGAGQLPAGERGPAGPAGLNGTNGANGANGTNGVNGERGPTGPAGAGAIAWAHVNADGTVDTSRSHNVTNANVKKTGGNFYCFYGLDPAPQIAVATLDYSGSGSTTSVRETTNGESTECMINFGDNEQVGIQPGTGQQAGFYIAFYG